MQRLHTARRDLELARVARRTVGSHRQLQPGSARSSPSEEENGSDEKPAIDLVDQLPLPASAEARAQGCTCPIRNRQQGTSEGQEVNNGMPPARLLWLLKEGKGEATIGARPRSSDFGLDLALRAGLFINLRCHAQDNSHR